MNRQRLTMWSLAFLVLITASAFVLISPITLNTSLQEGTAEADPLIPDLEFPTMTIAAEGDESADSILEWAETLDSDVGFDPDSDTNADAVYSEWDFSETIDPDVLYYPDTLMYRSDRYSTWYFGGGFPNDPAKRGIGSASTGHDGESTEIWAVFNSSSDEYQTYIYDVDHANEYGGDGFPVEDAKVTVRWKTEGPNNRIKIKTKALGGSDVYINSGEKSTDWTTSTLNLGMTYAGGVTIYGIWVWSDDDPDSTSSGNYSTYIDWIIFCENTTIIDPITGNPSGHDGYSEPFTAVNNWALFQTEGPESMTSDGDVGTFATEAYDASYDSDYVYSDDVSLTGSYFYEIRYRVNTTLVGSVILCGYSTEAFAVNVFWQDLTKTTSWTTRRFYDTDTLERVAICLVKAGEGQGPVEIDIDYLRIGSVMGWGHDGSTTEGVGTDSAGDWTSTISSNGSALIVTANKTGDTGDNYCNFYGFVLDTTTTVTEPETDYYSWIEFKWKIITYSNLIGVTFKGWYDGHRHEPTLATGAQDWTTTRYNMKEANPQAGAPYVVFYAYASTQYAYVEMEVDYIRAYGFNNWTYHDGGANNKVTGVAWYDSTEDALAIQKGTCDSGYDKIRLRTRDTSIGYSVDDMVLLYTVKAASNSSLRIRQTFTSSSERYYRLYDDWQQIAYPIGTGVTFNSFDLEVYDWSDGYTGSFTLYIKNNVTIRPSWYDASEESGTYADSFAGVSDWTVVGASISTDGDVCNISSSGGDAGQAYVTGSWDFEGYYYEYRVVARNERHRLMLYEDANLRFSTSYSTATGTFKGLVTGSVSAINKIYIQVGYTSADKWVQIDYLRIAPATEMGWQDDCSQISGWTSLSSPVFTDGEILHVDGTQGAGYERYEHDLWLKQSDYPFVKIRWKAIVGQNIYFRVQDEDDNWYGYQIDSYVSEEIWTTTVLNIDGMATSGTHIKHMDFYSVTAGNQEFWLNYTKFFSIANFTVSEVDDEAVTDVVYVDSDGHLVVTGATTDYMRFTYDITVSVAKATYNVWNATVQSGVSGFRFRELSTSNQYHATGESRGLILSTTLGLFEFLSYADLEISAIKFWEDNTAPTIDEFWIVPYTPTDDDIVTLTIVATELMNVYKVTFNAIESPSGFSDVDYSATESPIENDLWNYTFSSLTAGYYTWKVYVDDGAQNVTSILPIQIRENVLSITEIVLITATETLAQISGHSNKDASYSIYENDSSIGSGSVATGWFSISWTKDTTAGAYIELGIIFTAGAYTEWVNGSYSVASAEVLSVTSSNYGVGETTAFQAGYANLDCNYYIYEDDVESATGSLNAGDFYLTWTRQSSTAAGEVAVAIKFADGTTTRWLNWTYSKALDVAFKVEQWWMSLQLGVESYVEFYVLTSWENATVYVYDNETLMTTVTESEGGVYSYFWMSETQGLHVVVLNITHGSTVYTRTRTYYIPEWAVTGLVMRWDLWTFQDNYTMILLESNWRNCTFYVYLNSSLVATSYNDPVTLNFTRSINNGTYNLTIYADGGTQTYTISNIRYIVTEEGVSYDFSSFTGGLTIVEGDTYEGDVVTIHENPTGVFIDQATAAIVAVGSFLIIFTAFLVARELKQRQREKIEANYS